MAMRSTPPAGNYTDEIQNRYSRLRSHTPPILQRTTGLSCSSSGLLLGSSGDRMLGHESSHGSLQVKEGTGGSEAKKERLQAAGGLEAGSGDGRRGQGVWAGLAAGKGQGMDSPPRASRRSTAPGHLDVNSRVSKLEFCPPER